MKKPICFKPLTKGWPENAASASMRLVPLDKSRSFLSDSDFRHQSTRFIPLTFSSSELGDWTIAVVDHDSRAFLAISVVSIRQMDVQGYPLHLVTENSRKVFSHLAPIMANCVKFNLTWIAKERITTFMRLLRKGLRTFAPVLDKHSATRQLSWSMIFSFIVGVFWFSLQNYERIYDWPIFIL